jgi:hypothetical protein
MVRKITYTEFVYEKYNDIINEGMLIRHVCNNSSCINPKHLLIGTHEDNMNDMAIDGSQKGENNPNSIYKEEQIIEVKKLLAYSDYSYKEIAEKTNIPHKVVLDINSGYTWNWLLPDLKFRPRKRSKYGIELRKEIKIDIQKGLSYRQIKDKYGVSMGFIAELKKEVGN